MTLGRTVARHFSVVPTKQEVSQWTLARRCGISVGHASMLERGQRTLALDTIEAPAKGLDVPPLSWLRKVATGAQEVPRRVGLLVLAAALLPSWALAQAAGESVVKTGRVDEDLYVAGGNVEVRMDARDDVVAAGGNVLVAGEVRGAVLAAGGQVEVRGKVGNDVRAAGGNVRVGAQIGDEATLAGGNVELLADASVGGRAWIAGGTVDVAGRVGKQLRVAGRNVVVSGEIAGDAELAGENITIGPNARIHGNLTYASPREARIDGGARIEGKITRQVIEHRGRGWRVAWKVLWHAGLFVAALVLLLVFPRFSVAAVRDVEGEPGRCLGLGLLVLLGTPVALAVLYATLVGIPLALAGTAVYVLVLLAGYLAGALLLGDVGLRGLAKVAEPSTGQRVASIAVAVVVLWMVQLVPIVRTLVVFGVLLFGLGGVALRGWKVYRGSSAGASGADDAPATAVRPTV